MVGWVCICRTCSCRVLTIGLEHKWILISVAGPRSSSCGHWKMTVYCAITTISLSQHLSQHLVFFFFGICDKDFEDLVCSVQFSRSVVSDFLQPHELQQARPPCPSPTSRVHPNSCPLSRWCHQAISSSVIPFSSCPQSLPASGSFQTSQLFASGGQSIGVSASTSVLPMNTQDWSPLGCTDWISLQSKGLSRVFSNTAVWKHQSFWT